MRLMIDFIIWIIDRWNRNCAFKESGYMGLVVITEGTKHRLIGFTGN